MDMKVQDSRSGKALGIGELQTVQPTQHVKVGHLFKT